MTDIWMFSNDGSSLGPLPYDSAVHEEDLDGTDKLTVITRRDPQKRSRLVWKDASNAWHEHMVDSTRRTHKGAKPRTEAVCSNSVAELYGIYTSEDLLRGSVSTILTTLLSGTRWAVGTCDDFGVVELETWHKNVRECIGELCELVGGEMETFVYADSGGITMRLVGIVRERGSKSVAREFSWGSNASNIKREVGADEVYTAIVGYGAKVDTTDHSDYSARISVEIESELDLRTWGVPNGDGTFSHNRTTYTDNACTDEVFLSKQCKSILDSMSVPLIRYEFDAAQVDEAMWSDVRLGNLVLCTDYGFDPELHLRERVSHIKREFRGKMSAKIAIGSRANPLVDRFKSAERLSKRTTGNGTRTSRSGYTRGNYGDDYQAQPSSGQPHHIEVVVPPTKSEYMKGETFDFTGIVVKLFDENGDLFINTWYPDGIAPLNELTFSPTVAPDSVKMAAAYDETMAANSAVWKYVLSGVTHERTSDHVSIIQYSIGEPRSTPYGLCQDVIYKSDGIGAGFQLIDANDQSWFTCGPGVEVYRYDGITSTADFPSTDNPEQGATASMNFGLVPITVSHGPTFLSTTFNMKIDATWSGSGGGDF